jgi:hypothetical protein
VAIVSVRHGSPLSAEDLSQFANELSGYESLVPLASLSVRGVAAHLRDSMGGWVARRISSSRGKAIAILLLPVLFASWLALGSLPYSLAVPCVVTAVDQRTISSPRAGTLLEVKTRPGLEVQAGDLLAVLDAREEELQKLELKARLAKLDALIDIARGEENAGAVRVHEAGRNSALAELEVVSLKIEQAQIRAPVSGLVIKGDMRRRVGSRLSLGEPLFEMASQEQLGVELHIPENRMSRDLDDVSAVFSPSVRPHEKVHLGPIFVFPVSEVLEGKNVFLAESRAIDAPADLLPGMEGVAHLDIGWRPAWWVLTHRITDWMRLNFWF